MFCGAEALRSTPQVCTWPCGATKLKGLPALQTEATSALPHIPHSSATPRRLAAKYPQPPANKSQEPRVAGPRPANGVEAPPRQACASPEGLQQP